MGVSRLAIVVVALGIASPQVKAQTDASTSMCRSYMAIVDRAVDLGRQGVPINTAHGLANSALSLNPQLWRFLISAINTAYKSPEYIVNALNDGSLVQMCVKQVRGN